MSNQLNVAVFGAGGIVSLHTALTLAEAKCRVVLHVNQQVDPSDMTSALIAPSHTIVEDHNRDRLEQAVAASYHHFLLAAQDANSGVVRNTHWDMDTGPFDDPWFLKAWVEAGHLAYQDINRDIRDAPDMFRVDVPIFQAGAKPQKVPISHGVCMPTFRVLTHTYLAWLKKQCEDQGVQFIDQETPTIGEIERIPFDAAVVCPGAGWTHQRLPRDQGSVSAILTINQLGKSPIGMNSFRHHASNLSMAWVGNHVIIGRSKDGLTQAGAIEGARSKAQELFPALMNVDKKHIHGVTCQWHHTPDGPQIVALDDHQIPIYLIGGLGADAFSLTHGIAMQAARQITHA